MMMMMMMTCSGIGCPPSWFLKITFLQRAALQALY